MLNLYQPFTECTSIAEYYQAITTFIKTIPLFTNIPNISIETTASSAKFYLDYFGLNDVYIDIYNNTSRDGNVMVSTPLETLLTNNQETTYSNCKIFVVTGERTSGFWFYTPQFDYLTKLILTSVYLPEKNQRKYVLIVANQCISDPTTYTCRLYRDKSAYLDMSVDTKYASGDFDSYIVDQYVFKEYVFDDMYIIAGGNSSTVVFKEAMINGITKYIQLAGHLYLKVSNTDID